MRRPKLLCIIVPLAIAVAFLTSVTAAALGKLTIPWWTVDGGGTTLSTGEPYGLGGSIGQPDAGVMSGGRFTIAGGFWDGGAMWHTLYFPVVSRP